jgi:hypothetical protein
MWFVLLHQRRLIRYGHTFLHNVFPSLFLHLLFVLLKQPECRLANPSIRLSQWPRVLRRSSAAAWLLGSPVLIPVRAWMFVSFVCLFCVCSGLCDELIPHSEESYRLCMFVCDLGTSTMTHSRPQLGCCVTGKTEIFQLYSRQNSEMFIFFKSLPTDLGAHQVL